MTERSFEVTILGPQVWDQEDDNVDIVIELLDGKRFTATFFTVKNIVSLFKKNRATGECNSGNYLWATDMVIVNRLDRKTIEESIADLIRNGELELACSEVTDYTVSND